MCIKIWSPSQQPSRVILEMAVDWVLSVVLSTGRHSGLSTWSLCPSLHALQRSLSLKSKQLKEFLLEAASPFRTRMLKLHGTLLPFSRAEGEDIQGTLGKMLG